MGVNRDSMESELEANSAYCSQAGITDWMGGHCAFGSYASVRTSVIIVSAVVIRRRASSILADVTPVQENERATSSNATGIVAYLLMRLFMGDPERSGGGG